MPKALLGLLVVIILPAVAGAQVPGGNVFFGYSYYNTDLLSINRANTSGWEASVEGKIIPWVGIVADFDTHYGLQNLPTACVIGVSSCALSAKTTQRNFLAGPRISVAIGKVRPFAEALFGVAHVNLGNYILDTYVILGYSYVHGHANYSSRSHRIFLRPATLLRLCREAALA